MLLRFFFKLCNLNIVALALCHLVIVLHNQNFNMQKENRWETPRQFPKNKSL